MTRVISVQNVNQAAGEGFWWLKAAGITEESRNGPVVVAPGPVITEYLKPTQRVLFNAKRDANPVFHLLESLWMLAGRDDAASLTPYNARMAEYAELDGTIHGAYGHRWRVRFGLDQIKAIVDELRAKPDSRQCVMQMWNCEDDLGVNKKDRPCNTHVYFDTRYGVDGTRQLNMTVCCRSNDALWGAYGANVVHFSILQELMAYAVALPVGSYRQMSNNFHAYTAVSMVKEFLDWPPTDDSPQPYPEVIPLLQDQEEYEWFLDDCVDLFSHPRVQYRTKFFNRLVDPLKAAYDTRKAGGYWDDIAHSIPECDWKLAFMEWTKRREVK